MKRIILIIISISYLFTGFSKSKLDICHNICFIDNPNCIYDASQHMNSTSTIQQIGTKNLGFFSELIGVAKKKIYLAGSSFIDKSMTNSMAMTVTIASDDFSSNNGSGGSGWLGNWTFSNTSVVSSSPGNSTTPPLMFMNGGASGRADRALDLSGYSSATLTFDYECDDSSSGFEGADAINVLVSTDGGSTFNTTVYTRNGDQICPSTNDNQSANITVSIPVGSANTVIRFESQLTSASEDIYWDNILVEGESIGGNGSSNITCSAGGTEIGGNVFQDISYDGIKDSGETIGVSGITVTATDLNGSSSSAITDNNGDYTISNLTSGVTYRIEFTNIPADLSTTLHGVDNGTTVQFIEPGNCANLGLKTEACYVNSNEGIDIGEAGEWIYIGNPNNPTDGSNYSTVVNGNTIVHNDADQIGRGSVAYGYWMMDRYIRVKDFLDFLNIVDPTNSSEPWEGGLVSDGTIEYTTSLPVGSRWRARNRTACSQNMTAAQVENMVVDYVSFKVAARYANWIATGDINQGAYTFSNTTSATATINSIDANWTGIRLPTEDELYKALYWNQGANSYNLHGTTSFNANGVPTVSNVDAQGVYTVPNGNFYNNTTNCFKFILTGQGAKTPYGLYFGMGDFHDMALPYDTGFPVTTNVVRPDNQLRPEANMRSSWRLNTNLSYNDGFPSPSFRFVSRENPCNRPPGIGNRVWKDINGDGIQDPDEPAIEGVTIELIKEGSLIATTQTNSLGEYYFSDENAQDTNLNWIGTGVDIALLPNTSYIVRIADAEGNNQQSVLNDFYLTTANANSNNSDEIDSDASLNGNDAEILVTTDNEGNVDYSSDFGFQPECQLSINVIAQNCTEVTPNTFTAEWQVTVDYIGAPTGNIIYQRNSESPQTITPTGSPQTFTIPNIPADGGLSDTIQVYFANETSCASTTILKRPVPCPTNLGEDPGGLCNFGSKPPTSIPGTVFEDWDYDGAMNQSPVTGVQGVQVVLYDCDNNVVATTFTDSSGNYEFTGLTFGETYRVEFVLPESVSCWAKPTKAGADNGTTVQFVQPGNCASLGVASPADYCEETPRIVISCYENGDASTNMNPALVSFSYNASGLPAAYDGNTGTNGTAENPVPEVDISEIGAINGSAWQAGRSRLFSATFLKRFVGFLDGPGYIYTTEFANGSATGVTKFNLDGLSPANGGSAIDLGSVCRDVSCASDAGNTGFASDYELGSSPTEQSIDLDAFAKVGAMSYGDIDLQEDGNTLWAVNLFQKALISIDVSGNTGSLPGTVNQYLLSDLSGVPSCSNGEIRPWGLAFDKGLGYLGVVCDASISQNNADLEAYILSFDPNNITNGFMTVLNFSLDFPREIGHFTGPTHPTNMDWLPWAPDWNTLAPFTSDTDNNYMAPQPIIGDIAFNERGDMVIGFMDRFGHQNGRANKIAVSQTTETGDTNSGGDLIQACFTGSGWILEGSSGCAVMDNNITGNPYRQLLQNDGPSNSGEFYFEDHFTSDSTDTANFVHAETSTGLLSLTKGRGEVISLHYDPLWGPPSIVNAQGMVWHNTYTGERKDQYQVVESSGTGTETFAKANGLGDLQVMCAPAPIEIGNYVWEDTDKDGIQDACEMGIAAVTVELYKGANLIATTQTDANGQYYFSNKNSTDPNLNWVGTGVDTALLANTTYILRISNAAGNSQQTALEGFELTETDVNSNGSDQIDNDAALNGTSAEITAVTGTYGCVDHSFDFGFIPCVADAGDLATNPAIIDFNVCEGADLVNGSSVSVAFVADYTAADEDQPNATYYNYQYLLTDAAGTILQSGTSGDFDFSILSTGTYNIYGLSYSTNNSPNTVTSYLNGITGDGNADDISQIDTDETGEVYCLDLDGLNAGGSQVQVIVNPLPTLTVTNTQCAFNFQTYSIDVTSDADDLSSTAGNVTNNNDGTFEVSGIPAGTDVTLTAVFNATACEVEQNVNAPSCTCPTVDPPSNPNNPEVCDGATTPTLTVSVGTGETVDWYSTSSGGTALATGTTSYTPPGSFGVGTTTYYAETRNAISTCTSSTRTPVSLTVNANPTAAPSANEPCAGETLNILANAASGDGSYTYNWTGPNGFSSSQANPTINGATYIASGIYYLTVTDANLCEVQEQVNVLVRRDVCLPVKATIKRAAEN